MAINHYLSCVGHRIWYCDKDVIPINITLRSHNQTDNNKTAARLPTIPSSTASTDCGQSVYQGEWCLLLWWCNLSSVSYLVKILFYWEPVPCAEGLVWFWRSPRSNYLNKSCPISIQLLRAFNSEIMKQLWWIRWAVSISNYYRSLRCIIYIIKWEIKDWLDRLIISNSG